MFSVFYAPRMAPEVIVCDEQPDATYDNRVRNVNIASFIYEFLWNKNLPIHELL